MDSSGAPLSSTKTSSSTPDKREFHHVLNSRNILDPTDDRRKNPINAEEIIAAMNAPRTDAPTLEEFKNFSEDANQIATEAGMEGLFVLDILAVLRKKTRIFPANILATELERFDERISRMKPDHAMGVPRGKVEGFVLLAGSSRIDLSLNYPEVANNMFFELKGPDGTKIVGTRQARHDGGRGQSHALPPQFRDRIWRRYGGV